MKRDLTKKDYETILEYYKLNGDKKMSKEEIKKKGEDILAGKLCRCIKKVSKQSPELEEQNSLAICRDRLFNRRNMDFYNFKCKEKYKLLPKKKSKNRKKLYKTKKNITMKYKIKKNKSQGKSMKRKIKSKSQSKSVKNKTVKNK